MINKKKVPNSPTTQGVLDVKKIDFKSVKEFLFMDSDSISDLSEKELEDLLAKLKLVKQQIAACQHYCGSLSKEAGQVLKELRVQRVKLEPKTRKVILTVAEYEALKKLSEPITEE